MKKMSQIDRKKAQEILANCFGIDLALTLTREELEEVLLAKQKAGKARSQLSNLLQELTNDSN